MRSHLLATLLLFSAACGSSSGNDKLDGGGGGMADAALPDVGGGSITALRFAVVGDTRPPAPNDTANYPTAIITKIWQDVAAASPPVEFAVATGDYMFVDTNKTYQQAQLDLYMQARAAFSGLLYPAMGNHECTGATDSNCGTGNTDGVTKNMSTFIATMLNPIGQTQPYYSEQFAASDNSWTAKVVVVACNAWTSAQGTWLDAELAKPTTYTFVVRHESNDAIASTPRPPCGQSVAIVAAHPLTLLIVGHTHKYAHYTSDREIIVGNGGAPLTSSTAYGYVIVSRNADGTLTVTSYDYTTNAAVDTFKIKADGSGA